MAVESRLSTDSERVGAFPSSSETSKGSPTSPDYPRRYNSPGSPHSRAMGPAYTERHSSGNMVYSPNHSGTHHMNSKMRQGPGSPQSKLSRQPDVKTHRYNPLSSSNIPYTMRHQTPPGSSNVDRYMGPTAASNSTPPSPKYNSYRSSRSSSAPSNTAKSIAKPPALLRCPICTLVKHQFNCSSCSVKIIGPKQQLQISLDKELKALSERIERVVAMPGETTKSDNDSIVNPSPPVDGNGVFGLRLLQISKNSELKKQQEIHTHMQDLSQNIEELKIMIEELKSSIGYRQSTVDINRAKVDLHHSQALQTVKALIKEKRLQNISIHEKLNRVRSLLSSELVNLFGLREKRPSRRKRRKSVYTNGISSSAPNGEDPGNNPAMDNDYVNVEDHLTKDGKPPLIISFFILPNFITISRYSHHMINVSIERLAYFLVLISYYLNIQLPFEIRLPGRNHPYTRISNQAFRNPQNREAGPNFGSTNTMEIAGATKLSRFKMALSSNGSRGKPLQPSSGNNQQHSTFNGRPSVHHILSTSSPVKNSATTSYNKSRTSSSGIGTSENLGVKRLLHLPSSIKSMMQSQCKAFEEYVEGLAMLSVNLAVIAENLGMSPRKLNSVEKLCNVDRILVSLFLSLDDEGEDGMDNSSSEVSESDNDDDYDSEDEIPNHQSHNISDTNRGNEKDVKSFVDNERNKSNARRSSTTEISALDGNRAPSEPPSPFSSNEKTARERLSKSTRTSQYGYKTIDLTTLTDYIITQIYLEVEGGSAEWDFIDKDGLELDPLGQAVNDININNDGKRNDDNDSIK
ncbi:hypothetical protein NADFUDRAFT_51925 [Nadsonia fulvescens var. elongata DSM 6958]|uniref:Autophagy-related protein 14 n=1 Tax=Nadsonia fulvescens var. elongata DSM 6958 TaxID=857566 RepID=A0A1E3PIT1_9ASCO|nr:hypothetical protein NADFUDRAFT_51925 [Nadsonia fulvescens var. elongata DSM 6958]